MTQDQHFDKFLQYAYNGGAYNARAGVFVPYEYSFDPNFISLPVDAFGSDQSTLFRLAVFESLSSGNSKDVGLSEVCFEFHPSISVGYVKDVLTKWGCEFTSDLEGREQVQLTCTGNCGKCSPAEVHECHLKRNAKN